MRADLAQFHIFKRSQLQCSGGAKKQEPSIQIPRAPPNDSGLGKGPCAIQAPQSVYNHLPSADANKKRSASKQENMQNSNKIQFNPIRFNSIQSNPIQFNRSSLGSTRQWLVGSTSTRKRKSTRQASRTAQDGRRKNQGIQFKLLLGLGPNTF